MNIYCSKAYSTHEKHKATINRSRNVGKKNAPKGAL